jgi:Uncharacterized protein conserved in bacteria (DUF2252)
MYLSLFVNWKSSLSVGTDEKERAMTPTRAEQFGNGRDRRALISHRARGAWSPAPCRPDPIGVLLASNAGRLEELIPIRFGRMAVGPFTFLRGSAAVTAADLSAVPTTGLEITSKRISHPS